jgi:hypothetical protein
MFYTPPRNYVPYAAPYPMPYPREDGQAYEGLNAIAHVTFNSVDPTTDPASGEYIRFDAEAVIFVADRGAHPVIGLPGYTEVLVDVSAAATNDDLATAFGSAFDAALHTVGIGVAGPVVNVFAFHAGTKYEPNVLPVTVGVPAAIVIFQAPIDPMWVRVALWGPQRGLISTLSPLDEFEFPRPG